uniref:ANK_REP_REGION domain-containing protein n=1 Tax=Angiostrongylus cantonensis TaxID=6313 RepID=A0A0K0CUX9_ANGCA
MWNRNYNLDRKIPTSFNRSGGDDVYQTTFGTRHRTNRDDKGIMIVNVYPNLTERSCIVTDKERQQQEDCTSLPYWNIASAAARIKQEDEEYQVTQMLNMGLGLDACTPLPYWNIASAAARIKQEDEEYQVKQMLNMGLGLDACTSLPYWNIASAAARIKQEDEEYQYNKERAAKAWDKYLASVASQPESTSHEIDDQPSRPQGLQDKGPSHRRSQKTCGRESCDAHKNRGSIVKCGGKAGDASAKFKCMCQCLISTPTSKKRNFERNNSDDEIERPSRRRHQSAPPQIGRPFYGTTELEKCSLNAINHLLRAEKELRRVEFTAGNVLPQARQYIVGVGYI